MRPAAQRAWLVLSVPTGAVATLARMDFEEAFVTVAEAALRIGVSGRRVQALIESGEIVPVRRVGRALILRRADVDEYAAKRRERILATLGPVPQGAYAAV